MARLFGVVFLLGALALPCRGAAQVEPPNRTLSFECLPDQAARDRPLVRGALEAVPLAEQVTIRLYLPPVGAGRAGKIEILDEDYTILDFSDVAFVVSASDFAWTYVTQEYRDGGKSVHLTGSLARSSGRLTVAFFPRATRRGDVLTGFQGTCRPVVTII